MFGRSSIESKATLNAKDAKDAKGIDILLAPSIYPVADRITKPAA
jgi:hypothetical protein